MMKQVILLILIFLSPLAMAQQPSLLNDLDLPLMDGLLENREASILFDSPEGRIINAEAKGNLRASAVRDFYLLVLPSLGWKMDQSTSDCEETALYCLHAKREEENLTLNMIEDATGLKVLFALSPN